MGVINDHDKPKSPTLWNNCKVRISLTSAGIIFFQQSFLRSEFLCGWIVNLEHLSLILNMDTFKIQVLDPSLMLYTFRV